MTTSKADCIVKPGSHIKLYSEKEIVEIVNKYYDSIGEDWFVKHKWKVHKWKDSPFEDIYLKCSVCEALAIFEEKDVAQMVNGFKVEVVINYRLSCEEYIIKNIIK